MLERESAVRLWFSMWLRQKDLGMDRIFTEDVTYIESWGPEYRDLAAVKHWFQEWNTRGRVLLWDIKQFFHKGDQTVVEWYFKNEMASGVVEEFDGMSLVRWAPDGRISFLMEFGCNISRYNPYQDGPVPKFRGQEAKWF